MNTIKATGEQLSQHEADNLVRGGFLSRDKDGDLNIIVDAETMVALAVKYRAEAVADMIISEEMKYVFGADAAHGREAVLRC